MTAFDIEDSPYAEVPLVDIYDMVTSTLLENYHDTIRKTIVQILEYTMLIIPECSLRNF